MGHQWHSEALRGKKTHSYLVMSDSKYGKSERLARGQPLRHPSKLHLGRTRARVMQGVRIRPKEAWAPRVVWPELERQIVQARRVVRDLHGRVLGILLVAQLNAVQQVIEAVGDRPLEQLARVRGVPGVRKRIVARRVRELEGVDFLIRELVGGVDSLIRELVDGTCGEVGDAVVSTCMLGRAHRWDGRPPSVHRRRPMPGE